MNTFARLECQYISYIYIFLGLLNERTFNAKMEEEE